LIISSSEGLVSRIGVVGGGSGAERVVDAGMERLSFAGLAENRLLLSRFDGLAGGGIGSTDEPERG
jgi:hypothetical protein